ncbi:DNA glycosylase [Xylariales sp. AK1849]|nr:DNA glycosylase [Xylariales sp. AK1849]
MQTRAAARQAAVNAAATHQISLCLPSPDIVNATAALAISKTGFVVADKAEQTLPTPPSSGTRAKSTTIKDVTGDEHDIKAPYITSSVATGNKRKRVRKTTAEPVRGGWDVLPHNLGQLWTPSTGTTAASEIDPPNEVIDTGGNELHEAKLGLTATDAGGAPTTSTSYCLRPRKAGAYANNGAGASLSLTTTVQPETEDQHGGQSAEIHSIDARPKKRQRRSKKEVATDEGEALGSEGDLGIESMPKKWKRKARKTKDNPYGLTPGETPYPDWVGPSDEQCKEVYKLLVEIHDDVKPLPPGKIPAPSLEVAGCGEVPSVLDGLIRTVLSGSTTFDMADKMLQALVEKFGILKEGVGQGSVNWNNVRIAEYDDVYQQLKHGGLGGNKSKNIQAILQMVYDENLERRAAYLQEKETGIQAEGTGTETKTKGQKELEILRAEQEMLSLDHMHDLTTDEAMRHFVRYPGVGVKTAACVTLFSLQRPCFAVDTHVFRMSRWLGWVPQKTNEDNTFSHLEVRCPEHMKYGLHQLFIRHGKACTRCNDKSFMGTQAWNKTVCPLEHLVNRFTKRVAKPKELKKGKGNKKLKEGDVDMDDVDEIGVDGKGTDEGDVGEAKSGEDDEQQDDEVQDAVDEDDDSEPELSELDEAGFDVETFDK